MIRTRVGFTGGAKSGPTYRSMGDHMEAIQIDYDPALISYRELLEQFRQGHNPFNRSWSRQYASAVYYADQSEKNQAMAAFRDWGKGRTQKVKSLLLPLERFYPAEDYHQKYRLRADRGFMSAFKNLYPAGTNQALIDSTVAARLNAYLGGMGSLPLLQKELPNFGLSPPRQRELWDIAKSHRPAEGAVCPVP